MDKRNLVFIALFSLGLMAVNAGFHYWTAEKKRQYLQQKAAYEAYQAKRERDQLLNRTASIAQLQFINTDQPNTLALKSGNFIALVNHPSAPSSMAGLPLASFEQSSKGCALYFERSHADRELALAASKAFLDGSTSAQEASLLTLKEGLVQSYPITVKPDLKIESTLSANDAGFEPSSIDFGLVLISFDNHHVPVAVAKGDTQQLLAIPFARFDAIKELLSSSKIDSTQSLSEQFFVLQNNYLQLVVSTKGGALSEINLPFNSVSEQSIIAEVENDRLLKEQSPKNTLFPLHHAQIADSSGQLHDLTPAQGGYYPLLRRGIADSQGGFSIPLRPQDYTLSLINEYAEVSEINYKAVEFTDRKLVLEAQQPHRRIRRVYELASNPDLEPYIFNFEMSIDGDRRGLWLNTGVPEADMSSANPAPVLKYRISKGGEPDIENFELPKETVTLQSLHPDWICNGNAFFGLILDPVKNQFPGLKLELVNGEKLPSRLCLIDAQWQKYKPANLPGYRMLLPVPTSPSEGMKLRVFAGPLAETILKKLDKTYSEPKEGYDPNYRSCLSFTGWFSTILRPFAKFMMFLMNLFHAVTHSWVAAIVLLTCVLRLILYPLNAWSNRSMRVMQEISPKVKALQERYKNDPKRLQMEMVTLYRAHKVNPLSGCLPIVIQIPFLFSMLHLFKTNFSLRGASFIPGWIDDLAAPDVLFSWGYPLPVIGSDFHLLPILLGATMFLQSHLMNPTTGSMSEAQRQQKAMGNMMTIAFTFMFYNLPSGLNIYWLVSSLLGIAQQVWQQRQKAKLELSRE